MDHLSTTYYPNGGSQEVLTSQISTVGMLSQVLIFLLLVAAGAFLSVRFMNRRRGLGTGRAAQEKSLKVQQTHSLGNRQYLVVVNYANEDLLLGVSPGHIQTLSVHRSPSSVATQAVHKTHD